MTSSHPEQDPAEQTPAPQTPQSDSAADDSSPAPEPAASAPAQDPSRAKPRNLSEADLRKQHQEATRPDTEPDEDLEKEIADALGDQSLEDLMEAETRAAARKPAAESADEDGVQTGTVLAVQGDDIFVEMGDKAQGVLPVSQFHGQDLPALGQTVEFTVEGYDEGDQLYALSRKGAILAATWDNLEVGSVVEGRVVAMNQGGLELSLDGIRAFMPLSQIEIHRVEDLSPYVNRTLKAEVLEVKPGRKSVVLSRRKVLEAEAAAQREQRLEEMQVGDVVEGTVRTVMPYGAFVDIGGMDGLLHISDMAWGHVDKPQDVVKEGQKVQVKILKIDSDKDRISLGLKQTQADPWAEVANKYQPDQMVEGKITRLEGFGAFIELEPGIEGLIPISEMSWQRHINHPKEVVSVGETVKVAVLQVDPKRKRLSLSIKRTADDPWMGASVRWPVDSVQEGTVTRVADFGAFVELGSGVEGLVHISELSDGFVKSAQDVVREGQTVQVKVLSVDEPQRRIALSIKQAQEGAAFETRFEDIPQQKPGKRRKRPLKGGLD